MFEGIEMEFYLYQGGGFGGDYSMVSIKRNICRFTFHINSVGGLFARYSPL